MLAIVATPDVVSFPAFMPPVTSPAGCGGLNRRTTRRSVIVGRAGCLSLRGRSRHPDGRPGVVLGAPGAAGDGRLVAVSPAGFADIAVDPAAGPGRSDRRGGMSRRLAAWRPRHRAAFSRSISRKIAWPAWSGDATRKAAKSSGSSSRVTRKAPRLVAASCGAFWPPPKSR